MRSIRVNFGVRSMINRVTNIRASGFVLVILLFLLGCSNVLTKVNVRRVEGAIACIESINNRLLRTNRFTMTFGSGNLLLQIHGDDGAFVSQSVVDEYDYGRWWRAESTNGQDSAWVRSKNDGSNDLVPLDFQDELILMPLFWSGDKSFENLTIAANCLRDSKVFSLIIEDIKVNGMGGPYVNVNQNDGMITSREIFGSYSSKPEDIDSKMLLFEIRYMTNNLTKGSLIYSNIFLIDHRLGKVFPPTQYQLSIENSYETNIYQRNLYPEVSGSKYMFTDRRLGFVSQRDQQSWPARHTSEFKMATRSRMIITISFVSFAAISIVTVIFLSNRNTKKNE